MDERVDSPAEAVALARELQRSGRYSFFRGQTRDWPLTPTLFRLSDDARAEAEEQAHRFHDWVKSTAGLEAIAADVDAVLAVAQHYGLPTTFLDFSTDPGVAGFFATSGATAGDEACI